MKSIGFKRKKKEAFTLKELIVVVACVVMLGLWVLPTLATTKLHSASAGCLANLRRLQMAAEMYRTENNDFLLPNGLSLTWIGTVGFQGWGMATANTNLAAYETSPIGPYLRNSLGSLRCPADVVPSQNGFRVRSYSMNGQVGYGVPSNINPSFRTYQKGSEIVCPTPANLFVFCDESPVTLSSGYFQLSLSAPSYPDLPAAYLEGDVDFHLLTGMGKSTNGRVHF